MEIYALSPSSYKTWKTGNVLVSQSSIIGTETEQYYLCIDFLRKLQIGGR